MCVKLYYLGRAKVFSSVATDFVSWTIKKGKLQTVPFFGPLWADFTPYYGVFFSDLLLNEQQSRAF